MAENENNNVNTGEGGMTEDYLAAIEQLKKTTVNRSDYDALKAENKKLLDSILNGGSVEDETDDKQTPVTADDIKRMRTELFDTEREYNNLEYITRALELRNALIQSGESDPFIPVGRQISPTREDEEIAAKCAQVYQECIDYADGNSEVFTNELMRRTKDVRIR